MKRAGAPKSGPLIVFYSLNVSASSFNKLDAFHPFQTETAFAENEANVSGVRHRIELRLRRANRGERNGEAIVDFARRAKFHNRS